MGHSRLGSGFPYKETFPELVGMGLLIVEVALKSVAAEDAPPKVGNDVHMGEPFKEDK